MILAFTGRSWSKLQILHLRTCITTSKGGVGRQRKQREKRHFVAVRKVLLLKVVFCITGSLRLHLVRGLASGHSLHSNVIYCAQYFSEVCAIYTDIWVYMGPAEDSLQSRVAFHRVSLYCFISLFRNTLSTNKTASALRLLVLLKTSSSTSLDFFSSQLHEGRCRSWDSSVEADRKTFSGFAAKVWPGAVSGYSFTKV